jgi:hypothetical protein
MSLRREDGVVGASDVRLRSFLGDAVAEMRSRRSLLIEFGDFGLCVEFRGDAGGPLQRYE